jgi:hypothetical protein
LNVPAHASEGADEPLSDALLVQAGGHGHVFELHVVEVVQLHGPPVIGVQHAEQPP